MFQFKFCLWVLLGWRATDGADLTGGRMPELGGGGKWKVGARKKEEVRRKKGGTPAVRVGCGRERGRHGGRPARLGRGGTTEHAVPVPSGGGAPGRQVVVVVGPARRKAVLRNQGMREE